MAGVFDPLPEEGPARVAALIGVLAAAVVCTALGAALLYAAHSGKRPGRLRSWLRAAAETVGDAAGE
jgi:hypothetical protein